MKNRLKMVLCAVLLAAGLCACDKEDIDIDQLVGSWYEVYPENFAADGGLAWTFGADNTLHYCISDVFAGDTDYNFTYRVSSDGRLLTVYSADGERYEAQFAIEQCSRHRLLLKRLDRNSESDNCNLWSEHYTFEK